MLLEDQETIHAYIADGDSCREAGDWGSAKVGYLKALEELERGVAVASGGDELTGDEKTIRGKILEKIAAIDVHLAFNHRELGKSSLKSKDYSRAVEELEEAINLGSEADVEFLESVKMDLDLARKKELDRKVYKELTPFVIRGDDFLESGNFAEAILEYQESLKFLVGLPENHRFSTYVHEALLECRRNLIRPYLSRVYWASQKGFHRKAFEILQRVFILLDDQDQMYRGFLEIIRDDLKAKLTPEEIEEDEVEAPDAWEEAVKDYEEALGLYSSFTQVDPLSPVYADTNVYEDRFLNSRRKLADLYRKRGDRLRNDAKIEKAIKNYKEALKLYPRGDRSFHNTFKELKKLRAQLTAVQS